MGPVTDMRQTPGWRDIDFRPAPPGWRAVYLDTHGTVSTEHIAGWLIQEEVSHAQSGRLHPRGDISAEDRNRRVVPAFHDVQASGAVLVGIDVIAGPWRILAPGQPDPTAEEINAAGADGVDGAITRAGG
jgi:hypothetical protein